MGEMEEVEEYMKPLLPTVPEKCGPPVINLGLLIDFAVQQILHELTVLTELLPKKLDADRKISIVQFAHSTRALFIKLLAVVKWVKSSKKFESCSSVCYFLDQQSRYFVDTADRLVQLAREELVFARLPSFHVPAAVDVLTLGTYPRLPRCIKSRFIPDSSITVREEACVLSHLNKVVQSRLSLHASKLSPRISKILIKNGMVTMTVDGEFEVTLTLLGERSTTKWTLLNIRILVEDYEIGFGTHLVHPLQVNMLHNVLQLRLDQSPEPLVEVYTLLHSFVQTLQLDVLFCQATQLLGGEMRRYAIIERYDRDKGFLIINYWLQKTRHNRFFSQYRIKIFIDSVNPNCGLCVRHFPASKGLPIIDDRTGRLSLNRLLSETVAVRCRERLLRIREWLSSIKPPIRVQLTGKAAPTLSFPLLGADSADDEVLVIFTNEFSGRIVTAVRALDSADEVLELADALNSRMAPEVILRIMNRFRVLLMLERYRKAIVSLPVRIVPNNFLSVCFSSLSNLSKDRICLQFIKEDNFYLIISFTSQDQLGVEIDMHLLTLVDRKMNMIRLYPSKLLNFMPESCLLSFESPKMDDHSTKCRKWIGNIRQLTSAIATVDDRIAFMRICEELDRKGVKYQSLAVQPIVGGLILHITDFSKALPSGCNDFFSSIANCCLRLDTRTRVIWPFECTLINTPLVADFHKALNNNDFETQRTKTTVNEIHGSGGISSPNTSESVSSSMIDRLVVFSHMYDAVKKFAVAYNTYFYKFCRIVAFTYHKLVIAYGAERNMLMILTWRTQKSGNNKQYYYLTFGIGPTYENRSKMIKERAWNPHILLAQRLQERFNQRRSLIDLVQYLIDTISPLTMLNNFTRPRVRSLRSYCQVMGYDVSMALIMQCSLSVVDDNRVRLLYGQLHLEFILLDGLRIGVRDCSRGTPNAIRLRQFFNEYVSPELRVLNEEKSPSTAGWISSISGPGSHPPHQVGRSPASRLVASPMSHMSLSIPPADSVASSLRHSSEHHRSKMPILINHAALERVTFTDGSCFCLLEEYLFALSYLSKLGPALESYRREYRSTGTHPIIQFRQLLVTADSVRITVVGAAPPNLKRDPFIVNLNIHLDEETFKLKLKLEFEGDETPCESDIQIAEQYFVRCVARLGNELAVIAFANACRLAVPGVFSAIARIMNAQMNWSEDSSWKPSMQLVMWSPEGLVQKARISPGIVIDQTNISVLILLCLRPTVHDPSERSADASKYLFPLIYNTQTNTVVKRSGGGEEDLSNATAILSNVSEQYSLSNEPALWPAVYSLAFKFSSAQSER